MAAHNTKKLSVIYDKRYKDFVVKYPRPCDGRLAMNHLCDNILKWKLPTKDEAIYPYNWQEINFVKELEARGYDVKTLRFSIELKKDTDAKG